MTPARPAAAVPPEQRPYRRRSEDAKRVDDKWSAAKWFLSRYGLYGAGIVYLMYFITQVLTANITATLRNSEETLRIVKEMQHEDRERGKAAERAAFAQTSLLSIICDNTAKTVPAAVKCSQAVNPK